MSDIVTKKRTRSPINALKILNTLRGEKGLPKVSTRPKAAAAKKLTKEEKNQIALQTWKDLYPGWDKTDFVLPPNAQEKVVAEFEKRVKAILGDTAKVSTGKPRGRRPKAV
jgi:hypothetical protein